MELLRLPEALKGKGIVNWPKIMLVGKKEKAPEGVPYIRATKQDYVLTFRLLMPMLMDKHPGFDWLEIYLEMTGRTYKPVVINQRQAEEHDSEGNEFTNDGEADGAVQTVTLEQLASNLEESLDMDMLMNLRLIPAFMSDIREAIRINVTEYFQWEDGWNKKLGMGCGYLREQKMPKALLIIDCSYSIPDGVSAGLLTMMSTMADITHADVIVTAAKSVFLTNEQALQADPHEIRRMVPQGQEDQMFRRILMDNVMDYDTVICFGDSDQPASIQLPYKIHTTRVMSFFTGEYDTYGNHYKYGAGYCRWVTQNNPTAKVEHYTDWIRFFKRSYEL